MTKLFRAVLVLFLITTLAGCTRSFRPSGAAYSYYRTLSDSLPPDPAMSALLAPYSDSVKKIMEEVIATVGVAMEKKQPEGALGNIMTDAILAMAREKFNTRVDAAIINYGGIRLTSLMPGPLTRGKVFEMMPFNNLLMLQRIPGDTLQKYLDVMASYGGWPVSGITYVIRDKKAADIKINGAPLRADQVYTIANSDYIINGGDRMPVLAVPTQNIGLQVRDALLEYFERQGRENRPVVSSIQNRVTHAN